MSRRFYDQLGVQPDADADTIRKAYRKLARKYHPDVNPGDAQAEERFKEIGEAYAVLSDPERRKVYDRWGEAGLREGFNPDAYAHHQAGGAPFGTGNPFGGFGTGPNVRFSVGGQDIDPSLFEELFGGMGGMGGAFAGGAPFGAAQGSARKGKDLSLRLKVGFEEAAHGFDQRFTFLRPQRCTTCQGSGRHGDAPCTTCQGSGLVEEKKTLTVRIPSGAEEGDTIRLRGKGAETRHPGGTPGDLLLTIEVEQHPSLRREGLDLLAEVSVSPLDLMLGTVVDVAGLGRTFRLKVPAGTVSGQRLRIAGHGVTRKGRTGHLVAEIIADPSLVELDDEARAELDAMRSRLQRGRESHSRDVDA